MRALITGSGQDATYLAKFLLDKGYQVDIGERRCASDNMWRFRRLGIIDDIKIIYFDLTDQGNILRTIIDGKYDEIYNLAAMSFVGLSWEQPLLTFDVNVRGTLLLLEAIRTFSPKTKFYQASSSEMFGKAQQVPQNENTPFYPRSPYGVSKLASHWMTINYRESFKLYACCGILFNHESPFRGSEFVTKKIIEYFAKWKKGVKPLLLGNLEARRDWGYAADYVEAMWMMLQQKTPTEYVIATGETHSIKDFIEGTVALLNKKIVWKGKGIETLGYIDDIISVKCVKKFYRPAEVDHLIGDFTKARKALKWKPKTSFKELIALMLKNETT